MVVWQVVASGALVVAAVTGHTAYVMSQRRRAPTGRLLQFVPGSADEALAHQLRTGDVVRFSRDCAMSALLDGLACLARKTASKYDQFGLVVLVHGVPHVYEVTPSGTARLRPYDARIQTSRSMEVHVLPLRAPLPPAVAAAVTAEAQRRAAENTMSTGRGVGSVLATLFTHPLWSEAVAAIAASTSGPTTATAAVGPRHGAEGDDMDEMAPLWRRNQSLREVRHILRISAGLVPAWSEFQAPVRGSRALIHRLPPVPTHGTPSATASPSAGAAATHPTSKPGVFGPTVLVRDLTT